MSRILQHGSGRLFQLFNITLTQRSVDHTCLAETAATDTAALNFKCYTVLCCFDKWYNRFFNWTVAFIHVYDQLFLYFLGNSRAIWCKGSDGAVFLISDIIKCRNINSWDLCCFQKKVFSAASCFLIGLICIKKCIIDGFTFTNIKQVEKVCQRFRIVRTCTAADYDWT